MFGAYRLIIQFSPVIGPLLQTVSESNHVTSWLRPSMKTGSMRSRLRLGLVGLISCYGLAART